MVTNFLFICLPRFLTCHNQEVWTLDSNSSNTSHSTILNLGSPTKNAHPRQLLAFASGTFAPLLGDVHHMLLGRHSPWGSSDMWRPSPLSEQKHRNELKWDLKSSNPILSVLGCDSEQIYIISRWQGSSLNLESILLYLVIPPCFPVLGIRMCATVSARRNYTFTLPSARAKLWDLSFASFRIIPWLVWR